ncbi:DUF58 domain-containing protein [Haloarcula onubensis]|uniref:DUF58 domain-containing protein n=1 Tax=Haloarcula onubensis TaxID=2950539 RepID=A0ABU2FK63_9EURY|nr:DUF58 domain-containing protein [Halomicroarcula sp. S3CR25-11]MDS0280581.1 DUF58 domain-containing protein [Halomicroarcula sp. S3CR25-11]
MRPTLRGVGALAIAVGATVVGTQFGQPGLGAIAAPLFVALLGAAVQVSLTGIPAVERSSLRRGFAGESRTLELTAGGSGVARLTDHRPDALGGTATARCSLPATLSFDLPYERRGEYDLGPVDVTVTDSLGLVTASGTVEATDSVLVFPPVYRLGGPDAFVRTFTPDAENRETFDRLREYAPEDSLRDIHWKSSAKRDDLLVTEFDDDSEDEELLVAARAKAGHGDAMAAAAATVAVGALRSGFGVELATPDGTVPAGYGERHRTRLLEALARTGEGPSGREEEADVLVSATDGGVVVHVADRTEAFDDLTAGRENPLVSGVGA